MTDLLLGRGARFERDARRIAGALIVLGILGVVLLNVGLYQGSQNQIVQQRWRQIATNTEAGRDQVGDVLRRLRNEVLFIVGDPGTRVSLAALASGGTGAERDWVGRELSRARERFGFTTIRVLDAAGQPLLSDAADRAPVRDPLVNLARRAVASTEPALLETWPSPDGHQAVVFAAAVHPAPGAPPVVILFEACMEDYLQSALTNWPGFGPTAGAYLVRKQGGQVQFITAPPDDHEIRAGDLVPESDGHVRAAAMAVEGIESSIVLPDRKGEARAVVTRFLPEFGWGVVGQENRAEMAQGLRGLLLGLLVFDLTIIVMAMSAIWLWRRQFKAGLARREMEVTRRHAERVKAIVDTAFDAIVTFDSAGRVRSSNRAAQGLFGRPESDMDDQPIHRFLQWDAGGRPTTVLPDTGTVVRAEALCADGSVRPVEFSLGVSGEGEGLLYSAIVRDISERVEAERRIREFADGLEVSNRRLEEANAQLEEASRLKSEFLANTSHELRTPLNGMIGFLQLVLDGMCDSPEEERDFQRQALECSRHLLGLINDVLDIAKIEAGKLSLEIGPVDIAEVFDEAYTLTHVQAAQKGLKIAFEPPEDRNLRLRGDAGKIKQILINLVGNSLKFTLKGSITVRAVPHVDLGHCMIEVTDTGIGIPADRQKVIFEKFTQADGSTTRKYGGTGLGLAITRSLVELMGGIIGVQSGGPGMGTRMYFSLPVWNEDELSQPAAEGHEDRIEGPAGGALVLVVEDDSVFRRFLSVLLHNHGYRTVEAHNAESGWVLARRLRPSVIVVDYALTCAENANLRTGWDLAERLTTDAKTRHIPLIFVTGFEGELLERLKATAFARKPAHLMKPVDGNALVSCIRETLGSVEGRIVRLLMADDDPAVGAYVRKVLPEDRFHIEMAANGEECLHVLRTQPRGFDLLLLDLMMPEVSGYDVLREMTLAGLAPDLPVLVLTNFPEPRTEEESRLLERGLVIDVIPKTAVHENPQLLPHILEWNVQVTSEGRGAERVAEHDEEDRREAA